MKLDLTRRTALKGMLGGAAVTVPLPFLDIWLDGNGTALAATGAQVPTRFGVWFWGLGVNAQRFFPDKVGADYDLKFELEPIKEHKNKINVFSDFNSPLDGKSNFPHGSGGIAIRTGMATPNGRMPGPSFDVLISDAIGTRTRFRSLEISAIGDAQNSLSGRGAGNLNPAETSPAALYKRIFGEGFQDPNNGTFTPDPVVMARKSVISGVIDQRKSLEAQVGAADRHRLDQHFTSLRQLETQLEIQLTKPEPMQACVVPKEVSSVTVNTEIETVVKNHDLMGNLLVMALACDQTRVFNLAFNNPASFLTRPGSTATHHQLTHEEEVDPKVGYQINATYFVNICIQQWADFVRKLDAVKEGDRTLLDNCLVFAHSETGFAKYHTVDGIPMMTAGSGGGRVKTGLHIAGQGSPVSRVGLTLQQIMGVSASEWGTGSMNTKKTITEMLV